MQPAMEIGKLWIFGITSGKFSTNGRKKHQWSRIAEWNHLRIAIQSEKLQKLVLETVIGEFERMASSETKRKNSVSVDQNRSVCVSRIANQTPLGESGKRKTGTVSTDKPTGELKTDNPCDNLKTNSTERTRSIDPRPNDQPAKEGLTGRNLIKTEQQCKADISHPEQYGNHTVEQLDHNFNNS